MTRDPRAGRAGSAKYRPTELGVGIHSRANSGPLFPGAVPGIGPGFCGAAGTEARPIEPKGALPSMGRASLPAGHPANVQDSPGPVLIFDSASVSITTAAARCTAKEPDEEAKGLEKRAWGKISTCCLPNDRKRCRIAARSQPLGLNSPTHEKRGSNHGRPQMRLKSRRRLFLNFANQTVDFFSILRIIGESPS